jgi:transposase-like protein
LETALQGKDTQNNCARRIELDSCDFRKLLGRARIHGIDAVLHSNALYQYTDEFKLNVVNSVLSGEMPIRAAEREFNVNASVIRTWRKKYREGGSEFLFSDRRGRKGKMGRKPKPKLEDYEIGSLEYYKLKAEQLERENLLLKKALPLVQDVIRNRSKGKSGTGSSKN